METGRRWRSLESENTPTNNQGREINSYYENVDYLPSATASGCKCSRYRANSTEEQEREREVCPPKRTKVLLIVFAVCLVFALGGLCILGILYVRVSVQQSAKNTNGTIMARELDKLAVYYTRVREHLHINEKTLEKLNRLNHSTGCALCAVHWIHSGGKCYYFSTVKMNWTQSRDHCVTLGGHLVIINSKTEQDFVTSNVEETHWIGLNDLETEGHWVWVNNKPVNNSVKFWMKRKNDISESDNWTKVHPDGEDCACLGHINGETDFWMDTYCFEEKRFVCEAAAAV
ncbi:C-type lectin domain family 6 member A-like [Carassius auratus]|uniref:C-type lectin domain family 6 member A-like n=1 Tax=Carassius auratus TaxID=7957 RepID=A0A6P6LRV3_CARAU|nr:C-type lectin domain family 6 member A-like [Carassius auratus]